MNGFLHRDWQLLLLMKPAMIFFRNAFLLFIATLFSLGYLVAQTVETPNVASMAGDKEESEEESETDNDPKTEENATDAETEKTLKPKPKKKRPVRAKVPKGVFGEEKEKSPGGEETILGGTVPAIWEIERKTSSEDDNFSSILDRDSIAPAVSGKVVRYAAWLMQQYDSNGDGCLQEEEWKKMHGAPQAIDIDGDLIITLDELVRFLALYGENRTIHHPDPIKRYHQPRMISSQFQLFKPITPTQEKPVTAMKTEAVDTEKTPKTEHLAALDPQKDLTEEALESGESAVDDATYEEIIAGRQVPAEKKYHTPKEVLYGVPAWFVIRDRDGDGQVSLLEFAPSMTPQALALFGRLDKNGDGLITPDEVRVQPIPASTPTSSAAP